MSWTAVIQHRDKQLKEQQETPTQRIERLNKLKKEWAKDKELQLHTPQKRITELFDVANEEWKEKQHD